MSLTIISSARREIIIGADRPFTIIGERINPTGRKALAEELARGSFERVESDALAQVGAGAHVLDVNAGVPLADEAALLAEIVRRVQAVTDVPLCIDSSVVAALAAGLAAYQGKALVNSVTGEEAQLESVLPLVRRHGAAVVAVCSDDAGISSDVELRFAVAQKIVRRAADHGIAAADVVVDPLVLPAGAVSGAAGHVLHLLRRLRDELGVNTICGASNISFGLPNRIGLNTSFLAMAIGAGLSSAITNPLEPELVQAVRATDLLLGRDPQCGRWIEAYRGPAPAGTRPRGQRRRRAAGDAEPGT